MKDWIDSLFSNPDMLLMGHHQRGKDSNLGLGWIYYGLVRTIRPQTIVSIGSWRGFVPMVLAKALKDNSDGGRLIFIDPSLADAYWNEPDDVRSKFAEQGLENVSHFKLTTEQFSETQEYAALSDIGLLFVDGFHDIKHARQDLETFESKLGLSAYTVFHDSVRTFVSGIYGDDKAYLQDVCLYMDELKSNDSYQVLDFPFDSGMTLVRKNVDPDDPEFAPRLSKRSL